MDLQEFILNIPTAPRDRGSKIKEALDGGKIYISLITKNNKNHFKIYFKENNTIKSKQLKVNDVTKKYILENKNIVTFSESAKKYLEL